jgi:hypothetical protein
MKNILRKLAYPTSFLALVLGASRAHAAEPPSFSELPVGTVTVVPTTRLPTAIGARESVSGFYVAAVPNGPFRGFVRRLVEVVGDPKLAEQIRSPDRGNGRVDNTSSACFAESTFDLRFSSERSADAEQIEWQVSGVLAPSAQVTARTKDFPNGGVTAVHRERLVEKDGAVALESVDAWVDPVSQGARMFAKASLPLKLVTTVVGGVKVYAGRDERPDGKRFVQFVVVTEKDKDSFTTGQMWASRQNGSIVHGNCGHLRVGLPLDASGDQAVFTVQVRLPSDAKAEKVDTKPGEPAEVEVRRRPMHVQVSLSKTSRDKEPVVSVSTSWTARETVERIARR